jgi:hypothetical protein
LGATGVGLQLAQLRIEQNGLALFVKRARNSEEEQNGALEQKAVVAQQMKELVQEKKEIDESLMYMRDGKSTEEGT